MTKVQCLSLAGAAIVAMAMTGCQSDSARSNQYAHRDDGAPLVDDKYSLKADREQLDQYRKDVPPEKRRENDEMAYIMQLFQEVKKAPSDIRAQFDGLVHKKRELFDRDLQREREKFTNQERKNRDEFLKTQKSDRDAFVREKPSRERRDDFFKDQEDKRKEFFANQREKRDDFESDIRERRKSFEDYTRERTGDFNQEYRAYSKRYDEWKKQERERREHASSDQSAAGQRVPGPGAATVANPEADALERELDAAKSKAGTPLESGGE